MSLGARAYCPHLRHRERYPRFNRTRGGENIPPPPDLTLNRMDIYLLEAVLNGVLLGGVLALLALGLNLIFGVVDVVWIAYTES